VSSDRINLLVSFSGAITFYLGIFGIFAVRTARNLKHALYVYMFLVLIVIGVLDYQANNNDQLGGPLPYLILSASFYGICFLVAWLTSLYVPAQEYDYKDVPTLVRVYLALMAIYLCVTQLPGILAPSFVGPALFYKEDSTATEAETAQIALCFWCLSAFAFTTGVVSIYGFFNPHKRFIYWQLLLLITIIGYGCFAVNKADALQVRVEVLGLHIAISIIFLFLGGYSLRKLPNSEVYTTMT